MSSTLFYFVRHGTTDHTGHKLSGWMDTPLNDLGRTEAEAAARAISKIGFKSIYSSPVARCFQTAEIVAAPHRKAIETFDDLGEVQYGKWTDRKLKDLTKLKVWKDVQHRPSAFRFPDGETLLDVQKRGVDLHREPQRETSRAAGLLCKSCRCHPVGVRPLSRRPYRSVPADRGWSGLDQCSCDRRSRAARADTELGADERRGLTWS